MNRYLRLENYWRRAANVFEGVAAERRKRRVRRFAEKAFGPPGEQSVFVLADIGASGELPQAWRGLGPYLSVVGFEPDAQAFSRLEKQKGGEYRRYLNTALLDKVGEFPFYVTRKQMCSSLLRPNRSVLEHFPNAQRFDVVATMTVKTKTLDNALQENGVLSVDVLKLDTQGSELAILRGAAETLKNSVLALEVEVEFTEMYERQPLFKDVDGYLREAGFVLVNFQNIYCWKRNPSIGGRGELRDADAFYVRAMGAMPNDRAAFLKAAAFCALYGHFDLALSFLGEASGRGLMDAAEHRRLAAVLS